MDSHTQFPGLRYHPSPNTTNRTTMDSTPKRKLGRPRVRPIKPPPTFKRQKSLAETAEELVRWEVTLYQHQIAKIQSAAAASGISRPEALRRMIDEWEPV